MYNSHKFDSVYAEVAYLSSMDGTALEFGTVEAGGWFALVNVGGAEEIRGFDLEMSARLGLAAAYIDACEADERSHDMDLFVIIRADDQGFVHTEMSTDLETEVHVRWEELQNWYDSEYHEEPSELRHVVPADETDPLFH